MSTMLPLGTRIKTNSHIGVEANKKGTIVRHCGVDDYLIFVDEYNDLRGYHRSEFEVFVAPEVQRINSLQNMIDFRREYRLTGDWHNAGNRGLTAEVRGADFNNTGAWGTDTSANLGNAEELHVIFKHDGEPVATANLATLCAWASATLTQRPDNAI